MIPTTPTPPSRRVADNDLPALEPAIIRRIQQALARVGDFGEIGLVVVKGQIKFIQITCSESLAERPGE
jgi:hypothetical protein